MVGFKEVKDFPWGREDGPRDLRLGTFGQGGWGDTARGSGLLALTADDVSRPEVLQGATDDEVLGIGRAWRALETWTFARKLGVVRELIRRYPVNERYEIDEKCGLPEEWDPRLRHEVAAALGISIAAAGKLADLAWTLDARLPGIGQALEDNRLDPARVKMIADETSVLDHEDLFAKAEEIILAGLPMCRTWSDLQRLVQRAVITVDPDGAEKRRLQAEREHARVRYWRENNGTCGLQGTGLPTDQALAANANIDARALEYKAAGIQERMDILRVMAYLDILNGVAVNQRIAWLVAEEEARKAETERLAREAARQARASTRGGGEDGSQDEDGEGDGPGGRPEGSGPGDGGADCGGPGSGNGGGFPGDWPAGPANEGPASEGPAGEAPGDGDLADDDPLSQEPRDAVCPECGGTGGVAGLPVRGSLTVPVAALELLAELAGEARGPTSGARPGDLVGRSAGACPACGAWGGGRTSLPVREHLVFPLLTILGLAKRPGEAYGLGALDAGLMRNLAAAGARHPGSQFCLTVGDEHGHAIGHGCCRPMRGKKGASITIDPGRVTIAPSGRAGPEGGFGSWIVTLPGARRPFLVDIDPVPTYRCDHRFEATRYAPGARLRHLVQVRDGKCSFPACSRPARESDFEHARPFDKGGRTCACNAHSCSRSCHRVKQSSGWSITKLEPGWTRWTTVAGRVYEQEPWRYPT